MRCTTIYAFLLWCLWAFPGSGTVYAQGFQGFSGADSTYLQELQQLFARNDDAPSLERFVEYWESGRFDSQTQAEIAQLSKQLNQQRMRSTNGFEEFLECVNVWADSSGSMEAFDAWTGVIRQMKSERAYAVRKFLDFCIDFLREDALVASARRGWRARSQNWRMAYEQGDVQVQFDKVTLEAYGASDTVLVFDTRGTYSVDQQKWRGREGECNWSQYGISPERIYVKLSAYTIDMKSSGFVADSATLFHKGYFQQGLKGVFEARVQGNVSNLEQLAYPQFTSYRTDFKIDDFGDDISYRGGFGMRGLDVVGTGLPGQDAQMAFLRNNKTELITRGQMYVVDSNKIIAPGVAVSVPIGSEDSLYHPHLYLNYNKKNRKLRFTKDGESVSEAPFLDTYHQTEIEVDVMEWYQDSAEIKFSTGLGSSVAARFKSSNFFSDALYRDAEGVLGRNPLSRMANMAKKYGRNNLPLDLVAGAFGSRDPEAILGTVLSMHDHGFLVYKPETKTMSLTKKLFQYVDAHYERSDFDVIRYNSEVDRGANASLQLDSAQLLVYGISSIIMSDSQRVFIQPQDSSFVLKKGHDFNFKGRLLAGRMVFVGKDFVFDYDAFKIELNDVDSASFFFPDKNDSTGQDTTQEERTQLKKVKTVLQDLNGTLYIEDPKNKSSREPKPEYPIVDVSQSAFVYYDDTTNHLGAYVRDSFYFQPKPFVIDSADNFTQSGLSFEGTFRSAGIFPEFEETVELREDLSLGFVHEAPAGGYPVYHGKGKAEVVIDLSGKGLFGSGTIDYQGATLRSQRFTFLPDSMKARAQEFSIPPSMSEKYPTLQASDVRVFWKPYSDSLLAYSGETVFPLYEQQVEVAGKVILTPDFLGGQGTMTYENATVASDTMVFRPNLVDVTSGQLELTMANSDDIAYNNPVTNMNINIDERVARGRTTSDTVVSSLPAFQYQTQIAQFAWQVREQTLELSKPSDQDVEDAYMLSTRESADSLQFNASIIELDLNNQRVDADSVFFVVVGDAQIKPNRNELTIREDGSIEPLDSAVIVTSIDSQYHTIYNATANIFSGKYFTGTGYLDYINDEDNTYPLYLSEITTQEDGTTRGLAVINPEDSFYIGQGFLYSGDVTVNSTSADLYFDGVVLADHGNQRLATEAFVYQGEVNREDVRFNIDNALNAGRESLYSGFYFSPETNEPYMILMGRRFTPKDREMLAINKGVLSYDNRSDEYVLSVDSLELSRKERRKMEPKKLRILKNRSFRYDPVDTATTAFGMVQFPYELEHVQLRPVGELSYTAEDPVYRFEGMLAVDFPLGDDAYKTMVDSVLAFSYYQPDLYAYESRAVTDGLPLLVNDTGVVNQGLVNLETTGKLTLDKDEDELPKIWLSSVNMFWDRNTESLHSEGKLGLLNLQNNPVSKKIDGRFEIRQGLEGGGAMTLLLRPYEGGHYYFEYYDGDMRVQANDFEFRQLAADPPGRVTRGGYDLLQAEESEMLFFMEKFNPSE